MKPKILLILNLVFGVTLASFLWVENRFVSDDKLTINYLDVGQGDATLIDYRGRFQVLIDGGPDGKILLDRLSRVISPLDKKIEVVILSHPDSDHLAGLVELFDHYQVGMFLDSGQAADSQIFQAFKGKLEREMIEKHSIGEGSSMQIGDNLRFDFLNPDALTEDKNKNTGSVVVKMNYFENSFLFTGDADFETETDLKTDWQLGKVDVLKVGHHGSKSSTSVEFLKILSPEVAVVSVGKANRYGHPDERVLTDLEKVGAKIFRTDELGTITFSCISGGCILD